MSRCEAKDVTIDQEQLEEISQSPANLQTSNQNGKVVDIKLVEKSEIVAKKTASSSRQVNHSDDNRPEGGAPSDYLSYDEPKTINTT